MKTNTRLRVPLFFLGLMACSLAAGLASAEDLDSRQIAQTLKRSADWQIANPIGSNVINDWVAGPYYDGLLRLSMVTGDPKYLGAVIRYGTQVGWMPHYRKYHADDVAVGHAFLDVYSLDTTKKLRLEPMKQRLDSVIASPLNEELDFRYPDKFAGVSVTDRWTWCDALYMAPPTYSRLYQITGDRKYLEFMDREFRFTYDHLYDKQEKLFFRDATFFDRKTPNGKKTFWGRGNGWVYGGLALMLETLPKDYPTRAFYENLFREMSTAVLAAQQPDGLWRPSLLDPAQIPIGETSGSGFYVFGLTWGINHGLLDRGAVWPAVLRGWKGLMTRIKPDGYVGYVQRIGAAPDDVGPDSRQDYGTGAFLLAGSEIIRALGGATPATNAAKFISDAEAIAELKEPRAFARLVPERSDDLAWENDKVAFRIYGPALRASIEDSGIDVWCKRVASPVINKWYSQDLTKKISYHQDHGEGYDCYKVSDSRGCGGLGLWVDGKLVISDVYDAPYLFETASNYLKFHVTYHYPQVDGRTVTEVRTITLRMGEQLFEAEARFVDQNWKPISGLAVAVGLYKQNDKAVIVQDAAAGLMAISDQVDGELINTGLIVAPADVIEMRRVPLHEKEEQALCVVRTDAKGMVHYRAGFAWSKAGEIKTLEAWKAYLLAKAK